MISRTLDRAAATLFPGYFALVMATGIVSIASALLGFSLVAWALLPINIIAYGVLSALTLLRLARHRAALLTDLTDHMRGPGFFTLIAGTCVLGSQLILVANHFPTAAVLWVVALLLWVLVMYTFFTAVTIREDKPPLERGIGGAWLLAIVATQSISVLGTLLSTEYTAYRDVLLFFTLNMYLLGAMLYLLIITLIFYRFTFLTLPPLALTPPYWINMGAVAITTLAGVSLILRGSTWPLVAELTPFLKGFTLFFWASGTWWIPLLFILGAWRHIHKRVPFQYDPQYWGMVFPLGMYTVCTFQLSKALGQPFLQLIPNVFIFLALAAWLVTFLALLRHLLRSFSA